MWALKTGLLQLSRKMATGFVVKVTLAVSGSGLVLSYSGGMALNHRCPIQVIPLTFLTANITSSWVAPGQPILALLAGRVCEFPQSPILRVQDL